MGPFTTYFYNNSFFFLFTFVCATDILFECLHYRCFNLIDTAENLELRLITVKQELCDFVARTQATAPLVEGSKPNLTSFRQYGSHEVPTYSAAIMSAKPTTLQLAEYQRHIAANCGLSENLYLTSHGPSYFYRNTFTDKCFLEVENCAQSKSVNTVCPSPNSLPTDCSSKCNLGYSQFGIALPTEKENQCSQTYLNSPSDTVSNSESNLRTSQEENCKVEATEKVNWNHFFNGSLFNQSHTTLGKRIKNYKCNFLLEIFS